MKTLIEKLEAAKTKVANFLAPDGFNYGIDQCINIVRQHQADDALIARVIRNYKRIQGNYGHTSTLPPDEAKRYWNEWQTEIDIAEGKQEA